MTLLCKHEVAPGRTCGSYAFNMHQRDIDQGSLCDVHYWEKKFREADVRWMEELRAYELTVSNLQAERSSCERLAFAFSPQHSPS